VTSSAGPFLNTGVVTAFVQSSGTAPTDNNWRNSSGNGLAILHYRRLNKMGGKLSGPHDKVDFSLFIADITSVSVKLTVLSVCLSTVG